MGRDAGEDRGRVERARRAVKRTIARIMRKDPLMGVLLKRTWILASDSVPLAATDGIRIYVNPDEFVKLGPRDREHVLAHEMAHIVLGDPARMTRVVNKLADGLEQLLLRLGPPHDPLLEELKELVLRALESALHVTLEIMAEEYVAKYYRPLSLKPATCRDLRFLGISEGECRGLPPEGLFLEIVKRVFELALRCVKTGECRTSESEPDETPDALDRLLDWHPGSWGAVLNRGDKGEKRLRDRERIAEKVKRKFAEALAAAKAMGRLPPYAERLAREVLGRSP